MMHLKTIQLLLSICIFATTTYVINGSSPNKQDNVASNTPTADIFDVIRDLDVQNVIQRFVQDGTLESLADVFLSQDDAIADVNGKCLKDVLITLRGLLNREMWAIQMLDAIGKPHSGILSDMDLKWIGSYDECVKVEAVTYANVTLQSDPVHHFDGKYCSINVPLPNNIGMLADIDPRLVTGIDIGICVSDSCNTHDVKAIMKFVGKYMFNASSSYEPRAQCVEENPLQAKTIVSICVLSLLILVATIGTLYDLYLRLVQKTDDSKNTKSCSKSAPQKVVEKGHFNGGATIETGDIASRADVETAKDDPTLNGDASLNTEAGGSGAKHVYSQIEELVNENGKINGEAKIDLSMIDTGHGNATFNSTQSKTGEKADDVMKPKSVVAKKAEQRSILERIFLSFSIYSNGIKLLGTNQPKGALTCINGIRFLSTTWVILGHSTLTDGKNGFAYYFGSKVWQWTFYGIFSATVSVDTFFTMSGLLVGYLTLRELKKVGGASKMNWFMFYFHRYWRLTPAYMLSLMFWTAIFVRLGDGPHWSAGMDPQAEFCDKYWWTNLLYINNYVHNDKPCFGWSWYLANDMQFYVLSPLIIIPFFYNAAVGGIVAGVFLTATTAARAVISKQHEYTAITGGFIGPKPKDGDFGTNLYLLAHTRMGPYIVGLVTGYLLYRYKDSFKMKKTWNFLGWFACLSIVVLVIYGVYPDDQKHFLSVDESVAYVTLHRTAWGVAVCWIIFACATGHGGWINDFLSWSAFVPLARLSYCTYLVHVLCLEYFMLTLRQDLYVTDLMTVYVYLGNTVISYMAAFITSMLFEAPMMGLEKILFRRK